MIKSLQVIAEQNLKAQGQEIAELNLKLTELKNEWVGRLRGAVRVMLIH